MPATHYSGFAEIKPGYGLDVDDPGGTILANRDLYMPDRVTLSAINNSNLVLLPAEPALTPQEAYNTCPDTLVGTGVEVDDLQYNRQLCVMTVEGRRGMLTVTKASTEVDPPIQFNATIWEKSSP